LRTLLLAMLPLVLSGAPALPGEGGLCPRHRNELREVSADMDASRDALGAERHDTEVQERQRQIADRLDRLIAQMEKPPPPPPDRPPSPPEVPPPDGPPGPPRPPPCKCPFCRQPPPPPGEPPHGPGRPPQDPGDGDGPPAPGPADNRPAPGPAQGEFATTGRTRHGPKTGLSSVGAKWGELPPKVRSAIQACESARLPEKYRRLVEFYLVTISEERRR